MMTINTDILSKMGQPTMGELKIQFSDNFLFGLRHPDDNFFLFQQISSKLQNQFINKNKFSIKPRFEIIYHSAPIAKQTENQSIFHSSISAFGIFCVRQQVTDLFICTSLNNVYINDFFLYVWIEELQIFKSKARS
jgi:hypothetical protein